MSYFFDSKSDVSVSKNILPVVATAETDVINSLPDLSASALVENTLVETTFYKGAAVHTLQVSHPHDLEELEEAINAFPAWLNEINTTTDIIIDFSSTDITVEGLSSALQNLAEKLQARGLSLSICGRGPANDPLIAELKRRGLAEIYYTFEEISSH